MTDTVYVAVLAYEGGFWKDVLVYDSVLDAAHDARVQHAIPDEHSGGWSQHRTGRIILAPEGIADTVEIYEKEVSR